MLSGKHVTLQVRQTATVLLSLLHQFNHGYIRFLLLFLAKVFHYGSISLITEPCKSAHIAAATAAKDAGVILSYDPNLRLQLWPSAESAREGILSIWETADIIKISEEEISFLTQGEDPYDDNVVRKLYHPNLKLLLVTEGSEGCRYYTKVSF
ncbi:probable fructokinase-6, chloroplastic [Lycium ferocissimum]|uniref:probable fructokinase-6, chloroplastic n=1 Tax=Lycium ferocissimum TaxID=112874 RepID=UPI0028161D92|nr:probable fructokinase-6, chloroplastic [Lycium ferocissimum]